MKKIKYCIRCGGKLEQKDIDRKTRLVCQECGHIHYQNPLPVVAGAIMNRKKRELLLIKRKIAPCRGRWALPGGFVEKGESPEEAVLREINEEVGIKGEVENLIGVYKGESELYGQTIVIGYKVIAPTENYSSGKEVEEIKFFSLPSLPHLAFSSHRKIIYDLHHTYKNPIPTVDIIIEKDKGIVLIKRKNPPYGWALPGGFVDYGESLEEAVRREAKEETNLNIRDLRQFHTYSDPERDPRFHTVSTVFIGKGEGVTEPSDDAEKIKVLKKEELSSNFAFDHKKILEDYFKIR